MTLVVIIQPLFSFGFNVDEMHVNAILFYILLCLKTCFCSFVSI